jgi:hypothetical protein
MIGLGIAVAAELVGLWWLAQPFVAALVYFVVAEVAMQRLRLWRDSLMDTAHVMFGASLPAAFAHDIRVVAAVLAGWGALVGYGFWRRL